MNGQVSLITLIILIVTELTVSNYYVYSFVFIIRIDNNWSKEFIYSNPSTSTSTNKSNYVNSIPSYQFNRNSSNFNDVNENINWDKQFKQFDNQDIINKQPTTETTTTSPNDELAKTAANLINTVEPHKLDKFKNSNFFSLINDLATGKTHLDQNQFVNNNNNDWSNSFLNDQSSNEHIHHTHPSILNAPSPYNKLFGMFDSPSPTITTNDNSLQNGDLEQGDGTATGVRGPQDFEWENFQFTLDSLDDNNFESNQQNPYSFTQSTSNTAENNVKDQPYNAKYWYQLGISQQENESELQAIPALLKAVELDDKFEDAWLALSISYTNESDKPQAINSINKWLIAKQKADLQGDYANKNSNQLTEILCEMVRQNINENDIQPDLQVALGVLFSLNEEYDKSVDCFSTALSINPNVRIILLKVVLPQHTLSELVITQ